MSKFIELYVHLKWACFITPPQNYLNTNSHEPRCVVPPVPHQGEGLHGWTCYSRSMEVATGRKPSGIILVYKITRLFAKAFHAFRRLESLLTSPGGLGVQSGRSRAARRTTVWRKGPIFFPTQLSETWDRPSDLVLSSP